jgi:hypothetical protein
MRVLPGLSPNKKLMSMHSNHLPEERIVPSKLRVHFCWLVADEQTLFYPYVNEVLGALSRKTLFLKKAFETVPEVIAQYELHDPIEDHTERLLAAYNEGLPYDYTYLVCSYGIYSSLPEAIKAHAHVFGYTHQHESEVVDVTLSQDRFSISPVEPLHDRGRNKEWKCTFQYEPNLALSNSSAQGCTASFSDGKMYTIVRHNMFQSTLEFVIAHIGNVAEKFTWNNSNEAKLTSIDRQIRDDLIDRLKRLAVKFIAVGCTATNPLVAVIPLILPANLVT